MPAEEMFFLERLKKPFFILDIFVVIYTQNYRFRVSPPKKIFIGCSRQATVGSPTTNPLTAPSQTV